MINLWLEARQSYLGQADNNRTKTTTIDKGISLDDPIVKSLGRHDAHQNARKHRSVHKSATKRPVDSTATENTLAKLSQETASEDARQNVEATFGATTIVYTSAVATATVPSKNNNVMQPIANDKDTIHVYNGCNSKELRVQYDYTFKQALFFGGISGAIAYATVHPMHVVHLRMQNKTRMPNGSMLYKNVWIALKRVARSDGVNGLYRDLRPMLVAIVPETAAKLAVNEVMRNKLNGANGQIHMISECLAGGCSGFCQVLFTNPIENINEETRQAAKRGEHISPSKIVYSLGWRQMYRGSMAYLLRDVPFGAIYFTTYARLKAVFADANGYNSLRSVFAAACLAALPAGMLTHPAEFIRARLQANVKRHIRIVAMLQNIRREEGLGAFWKGSMVRCYRMTPQLGLTLLLYEALQQLYHDRRPLRWLP